MKKYILIGLLLLMCSGATMAQKRAKFDRIRMGVSGGGALLRMPMSGQFDVSEGNSTLVNGSFVASEPMYAVRDTIAWVGAAYGHAVLVLPLYQQSTWSTGLRLGAGLGRYGSIKAAEGFNSLVYDFPQYLYYRNRASAIDFSVLAGYKYTMAPLPLHLVLAGLEFQLKENSAVQFYGSLWSNKYYRYYTHGVTEEAFRAREWGVTFTHFF